MTSTTATKSPKVTDPPSKRKSKSKRARKHKSNHSPPNKANRLGVEGKKTASPLNGVVLSVSTLGGEASDESSKDVSYNSVANSCRELGAEVLGQVSKRVQALVCTASAVSKATQRVRKAHKKGIPILEVGWLEECRRKHEMVDFDPYLLTNEAGEAIGNRKAVQEEEGAEEAELLPDAGWSEAVSLGCCCVCHENGTEDSCKWCDRCGG